MSTRNRRLKGNCLPDDQELYASRAQRIVDVGYVGLLAESQQAR